MATFPHFPPELGQYLEMQGYREGPEYTSHFLNGVDWNLSILVKPKTALCRLKERKILEGVPSWTFFGTYAFSDGQGIGTVEVTQAESKFLTTVKVEELIAKLSQTGLYRRE